jgi:hypothetical protein
MNGMSGMHVILPTLGILSEIPVFGPDEGMPGARNPGHP